MTVGMKIWCAVSAVILAWIGLSFIDVVLHNLSNPDAISSINFFGLLNR